MGVVGVALLKGVCIGLVVAERVEWPECELRPLLATLGDLGQLGTRRDGGHA